MIPLAGKGLKANAYFFRFIGWLLAMQAITIILTIISIATIVGPVGAVAIMYHDNLVGLVITPQIKDLMSGNGILANNNAVSGSNNENDNSVGGGLVVPTLVSSSVNNVDRTFQVTINVTNPLNSDLTINSITSDVECTQDRFQLGSVNLDSPVAILSGQSSLVTVSGYWTQTAENHIQSSHAGQISISVDLINTALDINGLVVNYGTPIAIPDGIPIA